MRIIVLGGYGNFGARICRGLAVQSEHELIATARDPAQAAQRARLDTSRVGAVRLDLQAKDFSAKLAALLPGIVIHCAGPFQGQDYRVAEAALAVGAHYVDISDGRAFVARFAQALDCKARAANVIALSGASSVPALSSAVVDALTMRFLEIHEISIAIAPAQQAPRGAATLAAVLGYAGHPIRWLRNGEWVHAHGWQDLRSLRFAGLGTRWAAACDVPDLELLPMRYPGVRTVQFRAALELRAQHVALWLAAALRRSGLPLPIERWAPELGRLSALIDRFGSDRGGMLVSVTGEPKGGSPARVAWHLTAPANSGPEIPCMAAILMARAKSPRASSRNAVPSRAWDSSRCTSSHPSSLAGE